MSPSLENSSPRFIPHTFKKHTPIAGVFWSLYFIVMTLLIAPLHAEVEIAKPDPIDEEFSGPLAVIPEMVSVGDDSNLADPLTCLGAVQEPFQIGKYDVTVFQWSVFLNAVHVVEGNLGDPRHLYHPEMFHENNPNAFLCKITDAFRAKIDDTNFTGHEISLFYPEDWGTPRGHYYGSLPMTGLSVEDSKRYLNWLHHGAPDVFKLAQQDPSFDPYTLHKRLLAITETGAYDFTNGKHGELLPGARYFLPTLNQWYKVAYYQAFRPNPGYWRYPTQGNELPLQNPSWNISFKESPHQKTGANYATMGAHYPHLKWYYQNEIRGEPLITPVGLFQNSPGAYGTYDMGGNVRQWTSDFISTKKGEEFIAPGGSYDETSAQLLSTNAKKYFPAVGSPTIGLRVCARAQIFDAVTSHDSDPSDTEEVAFPDAQDPDSKGHSLFFQSLKNITIAQITSYGLEAALDLGIKRVQTREWISLSELVRPFTLQRNTVNMILSLSLAALSTGEAEHMNIKKADCWSIGLIVVSTVVTMTLTEGFGFMVESAIGKVLEILNSYGLVRITVQDSVKTATWARLIINIYYIGSNTCLTTKSDLDYFHEQQKKQKLNP